MGDMDSGNSGSIQSSSTCGGGDDQEFDSRAAVVVGESMPAFFIPSSSMPTFDNTVSFHHQLPTYNNFVLPTFSSTNFMINSNNNNNIPGIGNDNNNNDNKINDLGMVWPDNYDPRNCTTTGPNTGFNPNNNDHFVGPPNPLPIPHSRALPVSAESSPRSSDHPGPGGSGRNPKKRSRASRRAPTTVLTTDTNNFRQMVQEFTGIPAPPFSGRTRLDLFGGLGIQLPRSVHGGAVSNNGGSSLLGVSCSEMQQQQPQQPSYLLRPFPQKIIPHHPLNITKSSTLQSFINTPNHPLLTIQSLLQPSSPGPNATGSLVNEFALGHGSNTTTTTTAANKPTTSSRSTILDSGNIIMSALNHHHLPLQRQVNGSNDIGGSFNGNTSVNAGTSSDNHGGVTSVDSWICSSDN